MKEVLDYLSSRTTIDDTVVLGVSGGVDSMLLLSFFRTYLPETNIVVAHVHHGLREQSDEEYTFVQKEAVRLGAVFEGMKVDVEAEMKQTGDPLQVAARSCRYAFYEEIMEKHGASQLYLGHHGDDLMETVLMRMSNGGSGPSLVGIPFSRPFSTGSVMRPFLCLSKKEIYLYAHMHQVRWMEDYSNSSDKYRRNRFRHHVLPKLQEDNPKVHARFLEQSERRQEDEEVFGELVKGFLDRHATPFASGWAMDREELFLQPMAIRRRVLSHVLSGMGLSNLPSNLWEQLVERTSKPGTTDYIELVKGAYVVKSRTTLFLLKEHLPEGYWERTVRSSLTEEQELMNTPFFKPIQEDEVVALGGKEWDAMDGLTVVRTADQEGIPLPYRMLSRKKFYAMQDVPIAFQKEHVYLEREGVCVGTVQFKKGALT